MKDLNSDRNVCAYEAELMSKQRPTRICLAAPISQGLKGRLADNKNPSALSFAYI